MSRMHMRSTQKLRLNDAAVRSPHAGLRAGTLPSWAAAAAALLLAGTHVAAQGTPEDYERAGRFYGQSAGELVFYESVSPGWIDEEGERFWYRRQHPDGSSEFVMVDPITGTRTPAFDHDRLAAALSAATGEDVDAQRLPFQWITLNESVDTVEVGVRADRWKCALTTYNCIENPGEPGIRGRSPDDRWQAFVQGYDLYVRSLDTGEEIRLTNDGQAGWHYATPLPNPLRLIEEKSQEIEQPPYAAWSPDSTYLLTYRIDSRDAGRLTMVQHAPEHQLRPTSYEYVYPLPQDPVLPTAEPVLFRIDGWERIPVEMAPIEMQYYGGTGFRWSEDGSRALFR